MFKENIIEFISAQGYIDNSQDILPIPSKLNIPKWFKKLEHNRKNLTVKGCMPFLDSLTAGYLLKVPVDMIFSKAKSEDGTITTRAEIANEYDTFLNSEKSFDKEVHSLKQVKGSPFPDKNENKPIFKIQNPWIIKTPPGYSCLFVPPLNNNQSGFEVISGIVDTDSYKNTINFPIIFKALDKPLEIKRGIPYVQVIPFKRESWKMQIKPLKIFNTGMGFFTAWINNYKNRMWHKKRWI